MHSILDMLRGPALGVVFMIILLAGVIVVTAFAALVAQVGLLLRLCPQGSQPVAERQNAEPTSDATYPSQRSPKRSVRESDEGEVVDADWWYETQ